MSSSRLQRLLWLVPRLPDLAATLMAWKLDRQRYGERYERAVDEVAQRQQWSADRMRAYVDERLRRIVGIATTQTRYYRELFQRLRLASTDIRTVADLAKLPIVEKPVMRANPAAFVNQSIPPRRIYTKSTSGTTGSPLKLYRTEALSQVNFAFFEARCRRTAGMRFGREPFVMLGAQAVAPPERTRPPFWCYNYLHKQLYMSSFHLAERFLGHYVQELQRGRYRAALGFPSSLYLVGRYALDHGLAPPQLGVAITSSEMLLDYQRPVIEQGLGCRVFDQYGCGEYCVFAAQGRDGHMYVSPDYGVLEVVDPDGSPVPPGTVGDLVCTSLINETQLFIRYRVGDRGALSPERSPDRPAFPILQSIDGRSNKALVTCDGRRVTRLGQALSGVAHIRECQFVQEDWDRVVVRVVPGPGYTPDDGAAICANLARWIGAIPTEVVLVDAIERTSGGKFEAIVCRLTEEQLARGPG